MLCNVHIFYNQKVIRQFLSIYFSFDDVSDVALNESVSDTISECVSDASFSSEAEVDLDPASAMLFEEVRSGRLPTDHIFYRLILNALKFSRQISNPSEQFQHDNVLRSFCESIYRNGQMKAFVTLDLDGA